MKRELLTELVGSAALAEGYAFHTGEAHLVNGAVRVYPAAWLEPPAVRSHTGRSEGETVSRVTLHLMSLAAGDVPTESLWQTLEGDALAIVGRIAASPAVCEVKNVGCVPSRGSMTVHGETSVALTFDVTVWYYS